MSTSKYPGATAGLTCKVWQAHNKQALNRSKALIEYTNPNTRPWANNTQVEAKQAGTRRLFNDLQSAIFTMTRRCMFELFQYGRPELGVLVASFVT